MKKGIVGKKLGMTQLFDANGNVVPVTVIEAGPCVVSQKKTMENDGYEAVQIGYGDLKANKVNKPMKGHFAKGDVAPKKVLREFRFDDVAAMNVGDIIKVSVKEAIPRGKVKKGDVVKVVAGNAIQIFKVPNSGMEEVIVGVVGTLQLDVFQYRMKNEYGVDLRMEMLPYEEIRLIDEYTGELSDLNLGSDAELLEDYRGRSLLVFSSYWAIDFTCRRNPGLKLKEIVVEEG